MLGIPEWAIGVGVILLFGAGGIALMVRLLPSELRRHSSKSEQHPRLEEVQSRLGELDDLKQRVGELEERLDFAERLLTQQREGQRLGPPQR